MDGWHVNVFMLFSIILRNFLCQTRHLARCFTATLARYLVLERKSVHQAQRLVASQPHQSYRAVRPGLASFGEPSFFATGIYG